MLFAFKHFCHHQAHNYTFVNLCYVFLEIHNDAKKNSTSFSRKDWRKGRASLGVVCISY